MTTVAQTAIIALIEAFIGQAPKLAKRSKFSNVHSFIEGGSIVYRVHRSSMLPAIVTELVKTADILEATKKVTLAPAETLIFHPATEWFEYSVKAPLRS
jgi:hypothetical protein